MSKLDGIDRAQPKIKIRVNCVTTSHLEQHNFHSKSCPIYFLPVDECTQIESN